MADPARIAELKRGLEHAPSDPGPVAEGLLGWLSGDVRVCARCAGRLFQRGCGGLLADAEGKPARPVWADEAAASPGTFDTWDGRFRCDLC